MSLPLFNTEAITDISLTLSSFIGLFISILMGWKVWRNHLKYHVFRPMLVGFGLFLANSAIVNIYTLAHWKDHSVHGYEQHMWIAIGILFGYIIILSTIMYSAKYIFERIEPIEVPENRDKLEGD